MADWKYPLFGCFDNLTLCIVSYFLPCYTVGQTAEAVGESCVVCAVAYAFTGCIAGGIVRGKVRAKYGIEGSEIMDFCVHCWCPCCAVIQDRQETLEGSSAGASIARV